jgi:hypothetical protein
MSKTSVVTRTLYEMPSGTSEEHTTLLVKVIMEAISTGSEVKNMIGCVSSAQLYPCVDTFSGPHQAFS